MKKNLFTFFSLVSLAAIVLFSCQKELSAETSGNPGGGSGGGSNSPGWSFTADSNNYGGCIDTAYYDSAGTGRILTIDASDTAGNELQLTLVSSSGTFNTGTFTPANGALIIFTTSTGGIFTSITPASFSLQITTINDTVVKAFFSAALSDPLTNATFSITNGKIMALIGKPNVCGGAGGGGSSGGPSVFTLNATGNNCASTVEGIYKKDTALTSANKVLLNVNVTTPGTWNVSTAAVNGISFSGSGTFTATGTQTITLQGSGTPTVAGANTFTVTADSSTCIFTVTVEPNVQAPCTLANNTVIFASGGFPQIDITSTTTTASTSYKIVGTGIAGNITFDFFGTTQPAAGVYIIKPSTGAFGAGDVRVTLTAVASLATFTSTTGSVYVNIAGGKVEATFCDVNFTATVAGVPVNSLVSARMTEQ